MRPLGQMSMGLGLSRFTGTPSPAWVLPTTTGLTGAWWTDRRIVPGYIGTLVTSVEGGVSVLNDQSGAGRNMVQTTPADRPVLAYVDGELVADFDGLTDYLISTGALPMSSFIAAGAGYFALKVLVKSIGTNAANIYDNDAIFADNAGFLGSFLKSAGPTVSSYNWDGSEDTSAASIATGAFVVVEWMHTAGTIQVRVDGGAWQSAASGNTTDLTGALLMGAGYTAGTEAAIQLRGGAAFSTVPSEQDRDAIVAGFMSLDASGGGALMSLSAESSIPVNGRSYKAHCDAAIPQSIQTTIDTRRHQKFTAVQDSLYSGDVLRVPPPNRAELSGHADPFSASAGIWISCTMMIDALSDDFSWAYLMQYHQIEEPGDALADPVFALQLRGARYGQTRELSIVTRSSPTVPLPPYSAEPDWNAVTRYTMPAPLVFGRPYGLVFYLQPDPTGPGIVRGWVDGIPVVDDTDNLGYASSVYNYVKYGIYDDYADARRIIHFFNMEASTDDLSDRIANPLPL